MLDQAFLISKGNALASLDGLKHGDEPASEFLKPFSRLVEVDGGFRGLHDSLLDLCNRLPKPKTSRGSSPEFESEGAIIVHRALQNLPDELLDDTDFWLWLNIYQCRDIVQWRHGADANLGNYGIEGRFEGLLCRMFMRANLVFLESDVDPYALARRGSQDFWRSFMIRRNYGSVKTMARAIARRVNFTNDQLLSDDDVRILGPKITQLNSSYSYELLDEKQCGTFVEREYNRLFADATS